MTLTRFSVTRPVAATVLSLLIIVIGVAALLSLPVREYPDIDDPTVTATVIYPGASAAVVEREVVEPIEEAVSGIDGVRQVRSQAQDGRARIEVEFLLDRDLDLAAADVRDRISRVRNELPDQAEDPEIAQQSLRGQVVMWLVLTSDTLNRLELSDLADRVLVNPLSTVPGVAEVLFGGERRYAMRIHLDLDRLAARELTVLDVEQALRTSNLELPAGRLVGETRELTIRTMTELKDPAEFQDMILADRDGTEVRRNDLHPGRRAGGGDDRVHDGRARGCRVTPAAADRPGRARPSRHRPGGAPQRGPGPGKLRHRDPEAQALGRA